MTDDRFIVAEQFSFKDAPRFPFGMPRVDNANYLWIQLFYSLLSESGRAGFVMANSAADARASELDIRRQMIESGAIDVIVSIASNFFYTVTLPCTLWFFDKSKRNGDRHDKVLFIDARHLYQQVSRAHREFTPVQLEFFANIVRLYRGEAPENQHNSADFLTSKFPDTAYVDVPGLCKVATIADTDRVYCTVQKRIAEVGDILFSVRAPVGRINVGNKKIVIRRGLSAIRSKRGDQTFILQQLKHKFQEEDTMGSGTIFNAITKADLLGVQLLKPTQLIVAKFEEATEPISLELANLTIKNANLRQTRDLLLPKLISGEIDVSELDIDKDIKSN